MVFNVTYFVVHLYRLIFVFDNWLAKSLKI